MIKIRKIVVPTDFSTESLKALRYAVEFVRVLMGVEIVLVHVMEPPIYPTMDFADSTSSVSVYQQLREAATKRLEEIAREEVPEKIESRTLLVEGAPYAALANAAKEESADLIIIATHGHTGLKRMMLGSVAERVVRSAPCPVLTVREEEREFVSL